MISPAGYSELRNLQIVSRPRRTSQCLSNPRNINVWFPSFARWCDVYVRFMYTWFPGYSSSTKYFLRYYVYLFTHCQVFSTNLAIFIDDGTPSADQRILWHPSSWDKPPATGTLDAPHWVRRTGLVSSSWAAEHSKEVQSHGDQPLLFLLWLYDMASYYIMLTNMFIYYMRHYETGLISSTITSMRGVSSGVFLSFARKTIGDVLKTIP